MRLRFLSGLLIALIFISSCRDSSSTEHTANASLSNDALAVTKPLIKGKLYKEANLEEGSVIAFDTSQQIEVLDTTDTFFIKARIVKDTTAYTGYVLKAILPE